MTFTGIDTNGNPNVPLAATPNSDAARDAFFARLVGVGTETFETQPVLRLAPLVVDFGAAGSATLTGPGYVNRVRVGETDRFGRFSVPSATSTQFWEAPAGAGGIVIEFGNPIAAFGFYGIDIGDFDGSVQLRLTDVGGTTTDLPVPAAPRDLADGSVLYFGFIDTETQYTSVAFVTTSGLSDFFGFDNFSIGSLRQVIREIPPAAAVPAPGAVGLFGLGLLGLGLLRQRA